MRVPHVLTILFFLTLLTAVGALVVSPGGYARDADDRVVPDTFQLDAERPAAERPDRPSGLALVGATLTAPLRGMVAAASIIAFILAVGGAFKIVQSSGAFERAIRGLVHRARGRESYLVVLLMLLFSAGGAVFGMSEEIIPFVMLLLPLVRALGYPPVMAVAIPLVGSGVGFAGAMINPFTVGIAQAIAGLPPVSGWQFRTVVWVVLTTVGITYVLRAGHRLRKAPAEEARVDDGDTRLHRRHIAVFAVLGAAFVVMLWGIAQHAWYVIEIGTVFLVMGIVAGIVSGMGGHRLATTFAEGARELTTAALVVGVARGIVELASDVRILDPILHHVSGSVAELPPALSAQAMFLFQSGLNFLVPSGSGQAALTMPIMAPLADLVGLSRQVAVLAFQFGDGFTNLITPTSAVLMGSLEVARVEYGRWFRFSIGLQLWLVLCGALALATAVWIGFA